MTLLRMASRAMDKTTDYHPDDPGSNPVTGTGFFFADFDGFRSGSTLGHHRAFNRKSRKIRRWRQAASVPRHPYDAASWTSPSRDAARWQHQNEVPALTSHRGCQPPWFHLTGPNTRSKASDKGGASTDDPAPVNYGDYPDLPYQCEFPGCDRRFATKTGRGIHHRRGHPDWYDERANAKIPKKAQWSEEESALMARKEAELTLEGVKFINQDLVKAFPNRSLEGIKGHRRYAQYRAKVAQCLEDERIRRENGNKEDALPEAEDDTDSIFIDHIQSLPSISCPEFQGRRLQNICDSLRESGKEIAFERLAVLLNDILPKPPAQRPLKPKKDAPPPSRKMRRRKEYAEAQLLWRKDRARCIQNILNDLGDTKIPPRRVMEPFWNEIMNNSSEACPESTAPPPPTLDGIWTPITPADVRLALPTTRSAAGPDGVSSKMFRKLPLEYIARIFNIWMWCRRIPAKYLGSRTVFLPKIRDAANPGDFRPITIPPVITRCFHKILATRVTEKFQLDQRQRAFTHTDGCRDNTFLLDAVLRYHHRLRRPLYLASLDVSKAFDSVSHKALWNTMSSLGLPVALIEYLEYTYKESRTVLQATDWVSDSIHPRRGVKQGDPLSPILFNLVTHRLLEELPTNVGARIGGKIINAAAFADDLILFATTPMGLQDLISVTSNYLKSCGMKINPDKSITVGIRPLGKEKKSVVDTTTAFSCGGRRLQALKRTDHWKYLGIQFSPDGRRRCVPHEIVGKDLEALTRAPLKPQQRLFALKFFVVPKTFYQLALGDVTVGQLNKTDKLTRAAIRSWLNLPHDTPTGYFHASITDGGLGIPSLRWQAPLLRLQRLESLRVQQPDVASTADEYLDQEIKTCKRRLTSHDIRVTNNVDASKRWADLLHSSVDGAALKKSALVPHQHRWILEGTRFLSGRDYINCCRTRIGALPTLSRTSRGRRRDRMCRAGCLETETLNHVLQHCHRTHVARVDRHNAVASYITRKLRRQGYTVETEPRFSTEEGLRKPDIVAYMGKSTIVIDAQVVSEQTDLEAAHRRKLQYYSRNKDVVTQISERTGNRQPCFTSATLSWRGIWSHDSATKLQELGVLSKADHKILTTRVLVGSIAGFRMFNSTTSVRPPGRNRVGIG